jgi:cytochrome o ubiquinol oxidase subunit IV
MSSDKHPTHHSEHGTTTSYVIGFILSLVFTIIPYYLVVEKVVSGNALVATIMGFAVLQMIVQIVFFLHIGREKSPHWQLMFFVSTIGIIFVVVGGSLWIMTHLHYNMTPVTPADAAKKLVENEGISQIGGEKTGACKGQHVNHKVTIKDGVVSPVHTSAQLCDSLTFVNEDDEIRHIMFGTHPDHKVYDGEVEVSVKKGRPKTITLNEAGTHKFHDFDHPETAGDFTVAADGESEQ